MNNLMASTSLNLRFRRLCGDILKHNLGVVNYIPKLSCCSEKKCNCDCPQNDDWKEDPKDTSKECERYKKIMSQSSVESTSRREHVRCKDHDPRYKQCKMERIFGKCSIPKETFQLEDPCPPFHEDPYKHRCKIPKDKKCFARTPQRAAACHNDALVCDPWKKEYPMRHAGDKPKIEGGPITKRIKNWSFKC